MVDKADFIYLRGLPLYGDSFPLKIMTNAKSGTYLLGTNLNLDELSFLFSAIEQINENVRLVRDPTKLSKYGYLYQISPEICELVFEYQHNTRGYLEDGTVKMNIPPKKLEEARRKGKAIAISTKVDLEAKLSKGLKRLDSRAARYVQQLLVGEKVPNRVSKALNSLIGQNL